jgi:hypothetical protein
VIINSLNFKIIVFFFVIFHTRFHITFESKWTVFFSKILIKCSLILVFKIFANIICSAVRSQFDQPSIEKNWSICLTSVAFCGERSSESQTKIIPSKTYYNNDIFLVYRQVSIGTCPTLAGSTNTHEMGQI